MHLHLYLHLFDSCCNIFGDKLFTCIADVIAIVVKVKVGAEFFPEALLIEKNLVYRGLNKMSYSNDKNDDNDSVDDDDDDGVDDDDDFDFLFFADQCQRCHILGECGSKLQVKYLDVTLKMMIKFILLLMLISSINPT